MKYKVTELIPTFAWPSTQRHAVCPNNGVVIALTSRIMLTSQTMSSWIQQTCHLTLHCHMKSALYFIVDFVV